MNNTFTAVIKKQSNCWIGWIEEIPGVNCQEKTRQGLLETLKVTLKEAMQLNKVIRVLPSRGIMKSMIN